MRNEKYEKYFKTTSFKEKKSHKEKNNKKTRGLWKKVSKEIKKMHK